MTGWLYDWLADKKKKMKKTNRQTDSQAHTHRHTQTPSESRFVSRQWRGKGKEKNRDECRRGKTVATVMLPVFQCQLAPTQSRSCTEVQEQKMREK